MLIEIEEDFSASFCASAKMANDSGHLLRGQKWLKHPLNILCELKKKAKKKRVPPSSYNTMPYYLPTEQVDIAKKTKIKRVRQRKPKNSSCCQIISLSVFLFLWLCFHISTFPTLGEF